MIPLLWAELMFLLVLFTILNAARQRLGDVVARTCVVDARFAPPEEASDEAPHDPASDAPPRQPS